MIWVFIAYSLMPRMNARAVTFSQAGGLKFGLSLHVHPFFVYDNSEYTSKSAHMRRLA